MINIFKEIRQKIDEKKVRDEKKAQGRKLIAAAEKGNLKAVINILTITNNDPEIVNYSPFVDKVTKAWCGETILRGGTALEVAARNDHHSVVRALLNVPEIKLNEKSYHFHMRTPLQSAVTGGHVESAKLLAAKVGVDPNIKSYLDKTALMIALSSCKEAVPDLLRMPKLNINETTASGQTALHFAVITTSKNPANKSYVEDVLAMPGVDVNVQDKDGNTPLILAIFKDKRDVVAALLKAGADISKVNKLGLTAMQLAERSGNMEIQGLIVGVEKASAVQLRA